MKLIPGCCVFFLLLSVLIPKETEAILNPFVLFRLRQVAVQEGLKLWEMCFYSKCSTVNVPPGRKCPKKVFGIGENKAQAKFTAKVYAAMFGYEQCKKYVAECHVFKFNKGPKCAKKVEQ